MRVSACGSDLVLRDQSLARFNRETRAVEPPAPLANGRGRNPDSGFFSVSHSAGRQPSAYRVRNISASPDTTCRQLTKQPIATQPLAQRDRGRHPNPAADSHRLTVHEAELRSAPVACKGEGRSVHVIAVIKTNHSDRAEHEAWQGRAPPITSSP